MPKILFEANFCIKVITFAWHLMNIYPLYCCKPIKIINRRKKKFFLLNVAKMHRKLLSTESQFYFANISATEARIFMKFYMVVNYYIVNLSFKFHKDQFKNARLRVVNARTHVLSQVCAFMASNFVMKFLTKISWG